MHANPHTGACGDFCALGCGRGFENVRAGVCLYQFFGADDFSTIKSLKSIKFRKKKLKKKKLVEGARACAKTGVWVRAPHIIKMCAMCVQVRPKIRAH